MVNSSLRNTLARRNHKERAQPLNRQRLGLLEKHKDYVHRARDYKSKQDRIRKLREKAAFRNKDEFYFGMVKGKTAGGVAIGDRGNESLSTDVVRILKTQDLGYVRVQIAKDEKAVMNLRAELEITAPAAGPSSEWSAASELAEVEKLADMGIVLRPQGSAVRGTKGKGKAKESSVGHVIFVEGREAFEAYGSSTTNIEAPSGSLEESIDLGWTAADPPKKKKSIPAPSSLETSLDMEDEARTYRIELLTTLSAHLSRIRLLRQAEYRLQATKSLMGKGGARKVREAGFVEDENAPEDRNGDRKRWEGKIWKWNLERRR